MHEDEKGNPYHSLHRQPACSKTHAQSKKDKDLLSDVWKQERGKSHLSQDMQNENGV